MLGSIIGGAIGLIGNKMTNDANKSSAREANAFTADMMQNRHQWEVEDLRKAGLNPILSAGGTPSMGGSAKAEVADIGESVNRGVQNALIKSQIELNREQAGKAKSENFESQYRSGLIREQSDGVAADNVLKKLDAALYGSAAGGLMRGAEKIVPVAGNVMSGAKAAAGAFKGLKLGPNKANPGMNLPTRGGSANFKKRFDQKWTSPRDGKSYFID